ncbi:hypothetical protein LguiA_034458 [Lonicera macranthoides]
MGIIAKTKSAVVLTGRILNDVLSFVVFSVLDVLDFILCYIYKVADFLVEAEWRPCYCSSGKEAITSSGKILVSEQGESKVVCLTSTKLQLEEISDTLYTRPSLVSEVSKSTVNELKRLKLETTMIQSCEKVKNGTVRSTFTVSSTVVEMLQGKIGGQQSHPIPRWSDCDCKTCTSWTSSAQDTLFVNAQGAKENVDEDVLFIHGFISSSQFWTETLFPNFSKAAKSKYRLFAVDLLGFGRSPKPTDSLYTIREHLEMIERSVLEPYKVKSFHIVAHSLGCILALALAVKYPGSVKSLTLLAPFRKMEQGVVDYFPIYTQLRADVSRSQAGKIEGYLDMVQNRLNCDVNIFHGRNDELIPVECSYNVQSRIPRACVKVIENEDHITIVVKRQKAFARELEQIWNNASG